MWRYTIVLLSVVAVSCHAMAQAVVFTAAANAYKVGVKDQVQIQYTIRDAQNLQSVGRPSSPDFDILAGPFTSQEFSQSISNGRSTTSEAYKVTFVIQFKHEGTVTIPPNIAKDAAGHTYQSNSMTFQVVAGAPLAEQRRRQEEEDPFVQMQRMHQQVMQQMMQQQQQAMGPPPTPQQLQQQQQQQKQEDAAAVEEAKKDLFIKVTVDKNKAYVGEQITTSYKLYARIPMQMGISKLPALNGFWTQDFEIPKVAKPVEEMLNGKRYQVFLLKKSALFPQQAGDLELDPAEAKGVARVVQQIRRNDPYGRGTLMMSDPLFNSSFFGSAFRDVNVELKSSPVKVTIVPLPEKDKPALYGGAVGKFNINAKMDKLELTTDDVTNLTLTISGSGNLKLIEAPKLTLPNGLSSYDPTVIDTITGRSTIISGSKILTYAITPNTPGDYDIPAIEFSYFNPETKTYVTEHTASFKIHVKPGKGYAPVKAGNTTAALKDIHDIVVQAPASLATAAKPLLFTGAYWGMYSLPILSFIGMILWKRRDEELSKDTVKLRSKRANKIALQRLITARKLLQAQDKKPFYEEISKAIWLYLSDKLAIPLSALSKDTAREAMNARRVPETTQKNLENVMWECETALYASGGSKQMAHTYEEAIKVISDLEDVFKS